MADIGTLTTTLGVDLRPLNRSVDKAKGSFRRYQDAGVAAMKNVQKAMMLVTAAAAAIGIYQVQKVAKESVALANIQEKAEMKLRAVINATGQAAGYTADEMIKMAGAMQKVTTFGDEMIIGGMAILATFKNIRGEAFERTTKAALDMSTVMGTDVKSSLLMMSKAMNDPIANLSAMSRAGVQFNEEQKELIKTLWESGRQLDAQRIILQELESEFGKAAEEIRKTFGGSVDAARNALGDLKEEMGFAITKSRTWIDLAQTSEQVFIKWGDAVKKLREEGKLDEWAKNAALGVVNAFENMTKAAQFFATIIPKIRVALASVMEVGGKGVRWWLKKDLEIQEKALKDIRNRMTKLMGKKDLSQHGYKNLIKLQKKEEERLQTITEINEKLVDTNANIEATGMMMEENAKIVDQTNTFFENIREEIKGITTGLGEAVKETENFENAAKSGEGVGENYAKGFVKELDKAMRDMWMSLEVKFPDIEYPDFKKEIEEISKMWEEAQNRIQEGFADTFFNVLKGDLDSFGDIFNSFVDGMIRVFAEGLAEMGMQSKMMQGVMAGMKGGGGAGANAAGIGGTVGAAVPYVGLAYTAYSIHEMMRSGRGEKWEDVGAAYEIGMEKKMRDIFSAELIGEYGSSKQVGAVIEDLLKGYESIYMTMGIEQRKMILDSFEGFDAGIRTGGFGREAGQKLEAELKKLPMILGVHLGKIYTDVIVDYTNTLMSDMLQNIDRSAIGVGMLQQIEFTFGATYETGILTLEEMQHLLEDVASAVAILGAFTTELKSTEQAISVITGEATVLNQELYIVNDRFDQWIKRMKELGASELTLSKIEAKRIDGIRRVIDLEKDRVTSPFQGLLDQLIGQQTDWARRDWGVGDYEQALIDLAANMDMTSEEYYSEALSLYSGQIALLNSVNNSLDKISSTLISALGTLNNSIDDLTFGNLAAVQSMESYQNEYNRLVDLIGTSDDPNIISQAVSDLTSFIPAYLGFMSNFGTDYNTLINQILTDLGQAKTDVILAGLGSVGTAFADMIPTLDWADFISDPNMAQYFADMQAIEKNTGATAGGILNDPTGWLAQIVAKLEAQIAQMREDVQEAAVIEMGAITTAGGVGGLGTSPLLQQLAGMGGYASGAELAQIMANQGALGQMVIGSGTLFTAINPANADQMMAQYTTGTGMTNPLIAWVAQQQAAYDTAYANALAAWQTNLTTNLVETKADIDAIIAGQLAYPLSSWANASDLWDIFNDLPFPTSLHGPVANDYYNSWIALSEMGNLGLIDLYTSLEDQLAAGFPGLASGGLTSGLSIAGEKGAEWVVPTYEPERSSFLQSVGADPDAIGEAIARHLGSEGQEINVNVYIDGEPVRACITKGLRGRDTELIEAVRRAA